VPGGTAPDPAKGKRTETTVREYDTDGDLVKETTSIVVTVTPKADDATIGGYL
jgi:hypothetical protein